MKIKRLDKECLEFLSNHKLLAKWSKCKKLFEENIKHPSLRVELLEPKWRGVYSFRIDRKYRVLFFIESKGRVEVFQITNHYRK